MNDIAHHHAHAVRVQVRYLASPHPYVEPSAAPSETLARLKQRALHHFHLVEGDIDGGHKTYVLSHKGEVQEDLEVSIGTLADEHHHLELKLIEQFIQG